MSLSSTDEAQHYARRYRKALVEILGRHGWCERLTWPSECRGRTGYPQQEWCPTCVAAEALGITVIRPLEKT